MPPKKDDDNKPNNQPKPGNKPGNNDDKPGRNGPKYPGFEEWWKKDGQALVKQYAGTLDPNQVYKLARLAWKKEGFNPNQIGTLLASPAAPLLLGVDAGRGPVGTIRDDTSLIGDIFDFIKSPEAEEDFEARFRGLFPEFDLEPLYGPDGELIDIPVPGVVEPTTTAQFGGNSSGIGGFDVDTMNEMGMFGDVMNDMLTARANKAAAETYYEEPFDLNEESF